MTIGQGDGPMGAPSRRRQARSTQADAACGGCPSFKNVTLHNFDELLAIAQQLHARARLDATCALCGGSCKRVTTYNFDELLARSSLGIPSVREARKRTSAATVAEIVSRIRGLYEVPGHISSSEPSRRWRTELIAMGKKGGETTSSKVASQASKILSNPKSSAAAKSVAASALTQAANNGKKGK